MNRTVGVDGGVMATIYFVAPWTGVQVKARPPIRCTLAVCGGVRRLIQPLDDGAIGATDSAVLVAVAASPGAAAGVSADAADSARVNEAGALVQMTCESAPSTVTRHWYTPG